MPLVERIKNRINDTGNHDHNSNRSLDVIIDYSDANTNANTNANMSSSSSSYDYDSTGKGIKTRRQILSIPTIFATLRRTWWQIKNRNRNNQGKISMQDSFVPLVLFFGAAISLLWIIQALFTLALALASTSNANANGTRIHTRTHTHMSFHGPKRTASMSIQHPQSIDTNLFLPQYKGLDKFKKIPKAIINSPHPDYGNLQINFLEEGMERTIQPDPQALHGHVYTTDEYETDYTSFDEYYAFDDDFIRNEPWKKSKKKCRRNAWHKNYFPNCNSFHEIEIINIKGKDRFLGSGSYRDAFLQHETYDPDLVLKVNRFRHNPFNYDRYEFIRMDALVMERLTSSPRIADIYGHCATSVYSPFLPNEAEEKIIPGEGDGTNLKDKDDVDPQNDYTISEKLDLALQMAESIADLHGFKDGVLVHDDIQLAQFLFAPDGRLILNDFNRAEAMLFNEKDGKYCKYQNGKGGGDYRSPEEYKDDWLDQSIDVWSFGNNVYGLITGLWPMYNIAKVKEKQKALMKGEIAYLDPRYKGKNFIQDRLIDIMYRCWIFKVEDRADIFEAVVFLRETLDGAKKEGIYDGRF